MAATLTAHRRAARRAARRRATSATEKRAPATKKRASAAKECTRPTGNQIPTFQWLPADLSNSDFGDIAVDFARKIGYTLHPWQEEQVRLILSRMDAFAQPTVQGVPIGDPVRLWSARDCVLEVPRQNGKNVCVEVVELTLIFLCGHLGFNLIRHTAHKTETAHDHFLSLRDRIKANPQLMSKMALDKINQGFTTANGKEEIELAPLTDPKTGLQLDETGPRIQFKTRSTGGGRGPSPQVIVFDEAYDLDYEMVGTMAPSTSAQPNPLLIFTSSAPRKRSKVLHDLRDRALSGDPEETRLLYTAWNSPPGTDVHDRRNWRRCNPSYGETKFEEAMVADRKLMQKMAGEFEAEHLGIPEEREDSWEDLPPIEPETWKAIGRTVTAKKPAPEIVGDYRIALDVSPDHRWASFGVAGRCADGRIQVENADRRSGTAHVVDRAVKFQKDHGKDFVLLVHAGGPAASLIRKLEKAGVSVEEVSTGEYSRSTGAFIDEANAGTLRHLDDAFLTAAVEGVDLAKSSDASLWRRRSSKVDITLLVACTLALGQVPVVTESTQEPFVVYG